MAKMKLYIVEKFYYEVEIDGVGGVNIVDDYEDAREKFYENQSKIMDEQVPDTSHSTDYAVEVYDREWCD